MIIVINNLHDAIESEDKMRAFNNIIMACGEGKHVLWMPSKKLSEVISAGVVSGYNLRVLHELKDNARSSRSILEDFDFFVEVDFTSDVSIGYSGINCLRLSYLYFVDSASVQLPVFVAENLSDIEFYMIGSKVHLKDLKLLSSYDVKFRQSPGGGNTTINSFRYHLGVNDLVLCILDSDRKHPSDGVKETAARFAEYAPGWGRNYWLHILNCTEAENLVPFRVAQEVLSENGDVVHDRFLRLTPDARRFVDHKEGLTLAQARAADLRHGVRYWEAFVLAGEAEVCICEPLGQRFLEHCINYMKGMTTHKLSEMIGDRDRAYIDICRMVASWGVGFRRAIR